MKRCRSLLLWLFTCLWATTLSAQEPRRSAVLTLPTTVDEVMPTGYLSWLEDSSAVRSIQDVSSPVGDRLFRRVVSPVPNFGYVNNRQTARPIWLRLRVRNEDPRPQAWLAEIDFWCFDDLQLFVVDGRRQLLMASTHESWHQPVRQRARYHRHYWFPWAIPGQSEVTVYLRMTKQRGTRLLPLRLVRASAYEAVVQTDYLFWGGVLATLSFVTMMSLFFFLTTLDRIYSKYIICLLGLSGYFIINNGFLYQFFFAVQFWMPRQNVYFLFPLGLFYSQLLFVRTFLSLRGTPVRYWHTVGTVVLYFGLFCLSTLVMEWAFPLPPTLEQVLVRLFTIGYWLPVPIIGAYIVVNIQHRLRWREAWLYLFAVLPFYVLTLGQVVGNFGLIHTYLPMADYRYSGLAALFEILVLTFGLAYRYKMDRDQTELLLRERTWQQQRTLEAEVQALELRNVLLTEKEHIARDLHDNVGAHLAFVVTNLSQISDQIEREMPSRGMAWAIRLRNIIDHTREAVKLLRETIWAIHRESFTVEEFANRLDQYVNRYIYEPDGLQVDVTVVGAQHHQLTSAQVLNLFRIVQEALNNVVKHAQATLATVRLSVLPDGHIQLHIQDNGRGTALSFDDAESNSHYGLQNMQARAKELGGTFRIVSDQGTTVEVIV